MSEPRTGDRGTAIVIALFVAVVVVLIGTAHLMTTDAERAMVHNAAVAAQARRAAEAVALAVKLWFERPLNAPGFPSPSVVIRDRKLVDASDPYGGSPLTGGPQYKEGVDRNHDGLEDLFAWPYTGAVNDTLLGVEAAPDARIEDPATLAALSRAALGDERPGLRLRVVRVDLFAPPYVRSQGGWRRRGSGTIKVEVVVERQAGGDVQILARRTSRLVLERIPYGAPLKGPLHACGDAQLLGQVAVGWGALTVAGDVGLSDPESWPPGFPRALPSADGGDRLWTTDPVWVTAFSHSLSPRAVIRDPWLRLVAAGGISAAPSTAAQPWSGPPPPTPGAPAPWECCDRSSLIQYQAAAVCPEFRYAWWKNTARSGLAGTRYFSWDPDQGFREDAVAPGRSPAELFAEAAGAPALWFFDTADGRAPRDDDGDGSFDNLTPEVVLGGAWSGAGFVLLHTEKLLLTGMTASRAETLRAPAEPSVGGGQGWIDLAYPSGIDSPFAPGLPGSWERQGPPLAGAVTFRGVLVNQGQLEVGHGGVIYGALVGRGLRLDGTLPPVSRILWDASLTGSWPPEGWGMPRFRVAQVATQ